MLGNLTTLPNSMKNSDSIEFTKYDQSRVPFRREWITQFLLILKETIPSTQQNQDCYWALQKSQTVEKQLRKLFF